MTRSADDIAVTLDRFEMTTTAMFLDKPPFFMLI